MSTGYLVYLGDSTIDVNDSVSNGDTTTFTQTQILGTGAVRWQTASGTSTSTGSFQLGDDGNVYFIPDQAPHPLTTGGTALVQSYSGSQPPTPCFVSGTLIETANGQQPVETIQAGDKVRTFDGTFSPVLWTGCRVLNSQDLAERPECRPIELKLGVQSRLLRLSPQHAISFSANDPFLLVRAKQYVRLSLHGARHMNGVRQVSYHHLLLPQHNLVKANGVWCESYYPGPRALAGLTDIDRTALSKVLPPQYGPPVGRYATLKELKGMLCMAG